MKTIFIGQASMSINLKCLAMALMVLVLMACTKESSAPTATAPASQKNSGSMVLNDIREITLIYSESGGFSGGTRERIIICTDNKESERLRLKYPSQNSKIYIIDPKDIQKLVTLLKDSKYFDLGVDKSASEDLIQNEIILTTSRGEWKALRFEKFLKNDPDNEVVRILQSLKIFLIKYGTEIKEK